MRLVLTEALIVPTGFGRLATSRDIRALFREVPEFRVMAVWFPEPCVPRFLLWLSACS